MAKSIEINDPYRGSQVVVVPEEWKEACETDSPVPETAVDSDGQDAEVMRRSDLVDWEGPDDPAMALNWSTKKKCINVGLLSSLTLLT